MANLVESATWETGIYQLETTDPVVGGPDGVSNLQAKQLANRTAWLKQQVDALNVNVGAIQADYVSQGEVGAAANQIPRRDATGKVPGDLAGNAATADRWRTARIMTVRLSGDASGAASVYVSGAANWTVDVFTNVLQADNALTLDGWPVRSSIQGDAWGYVPLVKTDGVMEVGRYIDFHHTSGTTVDYAARLHTDGSNDGLLFINGSRIVTENGGTAPNAAKLVGRALGNASGQVPLSNGARCVDLNADRLDGYHAATTAAASTVAVRDGSGRLPGDITGNAATADRWRTARTLTLTGDASGSVSMDGSGSVSLPVTVKNDSHTHGRTTTYQDALEAAWNAIFTLPNSSSRTITTAWQQLFVVDIPYAVASGARNVLTFDVFPFFQNGTGQDTEIVLKFDFYDLFINSGQSRYVYKVLPLYALMGSNVTLHAGISLTRLSNGFNPSVTVSARLRSGTANPVMHTAKIIGHAYNAIDGTWRY